MLCNRVIGFLLLGLAALDCGSQAGAQDFLREPRPLAPGVLQVFEPNLDPRDSYSMPMRMPDLNPVEYQGNFTSQSQTLAGQTRHTILFRNVWQVEFATTGLRQVSLAYRAPDNSVLHRHYWYMVYRIRNTGRSLSYEDVEQQAAFRYIRKELRMDVARSEPSIGPGQILPRFTLEGWITGRDGSRELKSWRDVYLPEVAREIQRLEDPNVRLYDQQEISSIELPLATTASDPGIWGVAVWENIDARLDYISVFVRGLTNAWRIDPAASDTSSVATTGLLYKTLQLNFWRPGDEALQHRDPVYYGIPLVDEAAEQIEICRRYRLPGPVLRVYARDEISQQEVLIAETDGEVDLTDLESPLVGQLNGGTMPEPLGRLLDDLGITPGPLQQEIQGRWWTFSGSRDSVERPYRIRLEPLFWEKADKGIRFIGTLDHLWVYR